LSEGLAAVGARVGAFFGRGAVGVAIGDSRVKNYIHIHIHKITRRNGEERKIERERERAREKRKKFELYY